MNKKIITFVSLAVIATIFLLMAIQWGIDRVKAVEWIGYLMPIDQSHRLVSVTIELVVSLLALPARVYAFFIYGDHGSWSLPVLISLLALSGLMWGVIVERTVWIFSQRNTAH
jgi:hypothetical protein